jgi:hypothetical protein
MTAGGIYPAYSNSVAGGEFGGSFSMVNNSADYLMTRDTGEPGRRCPAFDFIQFRMTNAARRNLYQDFSCLHLRQRQIHYFQRLPLAGNRGYFFEYRRFHGLRNGITLLALLAIPNLHRPVEHIFE